MFHYCKMNQEGSEGLQKVYKSELCTFRDIIDEMITSKYLSSYSANFTNAIKLQADKKYLKNAIV